MVIGAGSIEDGQTRCMVTSRSPPQMPSSWRQKLGWGEKGGGAAALSVLAGGGGLHSFVATALESLGYPLTGTKP